MLSLAFPMLTTEEMPIPPKIQVLLLMKILTYDRVLKNRVSDIVKIGILTTKEDESKKVGKEIEKVVKNLSDKKIHGCRIAYKVIEYTSEETLAATVKSEKVTVLYVAPSNKSNIKAITKITHEKKV